MKSIEAVELAISKINSIDNSNYCLNSVIEIDREALKLADQYDKSEIELPLQGLPILVKDNIESMRLPATAGSLALKNTPVTKDASLVTRLRSAGAIILGATNLSEWANIRSSKSTSGWSAVGGLTANPWKHQHSAGGSSSGSGAAVAAGLTQWAIGSETDGSIICPASLNGCVGIKPTVGVIPRDGMIPISSSQDSAGPITHTVAQAAILLDVLSNSSQYHAFIEKDHEIRYGFVSSWLTTNLGVDSLFETTLKILRHNGIKLVEVNLEPPTDEVHQDELKVLLYELYQGLGEYLAQRPGSKVLSLEDIIHFNNEYNSEELVHFNQDLFEEAIEISKKRDLYLEARRRNLNWAEKTLRAGMENVDVLIGCTYGPAWLSSLGAGDSIASSSWITTAPAIAGTPIGTIPMGLVDGLPVGLGFVVRRNEELKLVKAMSQVEKLLGIGSLTPTFIK